MTDIKIIDVAEVDASDFKILISDAIIFTHDHKLLLQKRPESWGGIAAGKITLFGGHGEDGETAVQILERELNEELGAQVSSAKFLFAITESWTNYSELVHIYAWKDQKNSITGCYEGEIIEFDTIEEALKRDELMVYTRFVLKKALRENLCGSL